MNRTISIEELNKFLDEKLEIAKRTVKPHYDSFEKGITGGYLLAIDEILDFLKTKSL